MIRPCKSLELALRLAGQEAAAAGFGEIEPEHLCMGLLKLAEMDLDSLARGKSDLPATQVMLTEVQGLREFLERCGVDSTHARREIRRLRGREGVASDVGLLHRSSSSRQICEEAGRLAEASGAESVGAGHLLRVLMEANVPLVTEVLGVAPARVSVVAPAASPALSESLEGAGPRSVQGRGGGSRRTGKGRNCGTPEESVAPAVPEPPRAKPTDRAGAVDGAASLERAASRARDVAALGAATPETRWRELRALVFGEGEAPLAHRPAEGRALARILAEPTRPSVALVCAADGPALAAVAAAARILGDARTASRANARQFCSLSPEAMVRLEELWGELAGRPDLVLLLPPLLQQDAGSRQLLGLLAHGTVQAVLRVDPGLYHAGLRRDPLFRKAVHAMHVQDHVLDEVPWSL